MSKLDWTREVHRSDGSAEYETIDEAITAALADLGPGGIVSIHDEHCEIDSKDEATCTCEPLEIRKGATA